jgi:glycopeptide antibiotics resistance protein
MVFVGIFYEYLCILLPCLLFEFIVIKRQRRKMFPNGAIHFAEVVTFLLSIVLIFLVTGIGNIRDIGRYPNIAPLHEINLIPFRAVSSKMSALEEMANIVLFLPFGFFLPFFWKQYGAVWRTIGAGFLFSGCIELSQLLNRRITDIDDLIMNTLGVFFGWTIFTFCQKRFSRKWEREPIGNSDQPNTPFPMRHEACFLLILAWIGAFFLYDPLFI